MTRISAFFQNPDVIASLILVAVVGLIQTALVMALKNKQEVLNEGRRRWITAVQNVTAVIIVLGLLLIWSPQLSALALSVAAFAVAIVVALKEMILSVVGAIHRASTRPFEVGDWIEVAGMRGEVTDEGPLSFRMLELGRGGRSNLYTGRVLVFPNSRLLAEPVVNESFRKRFLHHTFAITLDAGSPPSDVMQLIRDRLDTLLASHRDLGARYHALVRRKTQADLPSPDPIVRVHTTDLAKIVFTVTMFCPATEAARIETDITESVLDHVVQAIEARKARDAALQKV